MKESPALDSTQNPETPEERALRFTEEEEALQQLLVKVDASGDAANLLKDQLAQKQRTEAELNRKFETLDEFTTYEHDAKRYAEHKLEGESDFSPDPRGIYVQGELVALNDVDYVFMGVNNENNAILRGLEIDSEGNMTEYDGMPMSDLYLAIQGEGEQVKNDEEEAVPPPTTESEAGHVDAEPAQVEPDAAPDDVAEEVEPERELSPEERKELANELNSIIDIIDKQRDIVVRYKADKMDRVGNPKYTDAEYEEAEAILASLRTKPKELALAIAGKEKLMGNVKIPDIVALNTYEQQVTAKDKATREEQKKALSQEEQEAYHEAFGRRKNFVQPLIDSGVRKAAAYGIYKGFLDRAGLLQEFKERYDKAEAMYVNEGEEDYNLLKWHGIKNGKWPAIIGQIKAKLEEFTTIPEPEEPERPPRVVPITRMSDKEDVKPPPPPQEEKEEAAPPAPSSPSTPLSGVYEVRDGHVYNSSDTGADASRLDTDAPLPRVSDLEKRGNLSGATQPVPTPVFSAKDGRVAYDRDLDSEIAREKETLDALMGNRNAVRSAIAAPPASQERNPLLSGLYNVAESGAVLTGLTPGEGKVVAAASQNGENAPVKDNATEVAQGFSGVAPNEGVKDEGRQNVEQETITINRNVVKQFEERFGMHASDLEKIPGFTELTFGQQLLTFERMKKAALEDIDTEKVKRYRARINELSASDSWWNKLKSVGMKATKTFQLGRMKDEVSKEWLEAGGVDSAAMKQSTLEGLVQQAQEAKEFDIVSENGKWSTVYISEEDFGEHLDDATKAKIQHFNMLANSFAGKGFAGDAEELRQSYETSAREMTQLFAEQKEGRWSGENAAAWRVKVEGAVHMARFFEDNPDLDKELDVAGKNIGAAISFKNLLTERGLIYGVSMGARYLGVSVLGLAAIPAVAAGVGGVMGWRRAKEELSENDLLAQMGERDKSDDMAKKEGGTNEKDRARNVVSGKLLVAKLEKLVSEYDQASDTIMVETSARDENGRLLFRDIPGTGGKNIVMETVSRKEALRRELEARVAYTVRKMEEGLVDLGSVRALRAEHISKFALTLGNAQAQLGFAGAGLNAFETRMNNILDIREEKIEANRKAHLIRQAAKGAAWGVGFSAAGMLVGSMIPGSAKAGGFTIPSGAEDEAADVPGTAAAESPVTTPPEAVVANELVSVPHYGGEDVETIVYAVKAGDNLTALIKERLQIMEDLTPAQQENVIQNFLRGITPEELKAIGLTDVNHIEVGQKIDIGKLNEALLSKRLDGKDLFAHAWELGHGSPATPGVEMAPSSAEPALSQEIIGTLPPAETSLIEQYVGRSISASESNVLHSIKGLRLVVESEEEQKLIDAAFNHLQLAMREADRPLLLSEMRRILERHGGIDARIQFPEIPIPARSPEVIAAPSAAETLPAPKVTPTTPERVSAPVSETVPSVRATAPTPEQIANWNKYSELQKMPLAQGAASTYLKLDTDRLYGTDMLGNSAPAWTALAARPAGEVFGLQGERIIAEASVSDPFVKILTYAKEQGFIRAKGYAPMSGETVEQFLKRAHAMKVLEDGPRK